MAKDKVKSEKKKGKKKGKKKSDDKKVVDETKVDKKKSSSKKGDKKKSSSKKGDKKKTTAPKKSKVERDKFGFKEGSVTSRAAAMYNRENGATTAEIKKSFGSAQLNLLKVVEEKGFKVTKKKEKPKKGRTVVRYIISGKAKKS